MSAILLSVAVLAASFTVAVWLVFRRKSKAVKQTDRRILFPFRGQSLSSSALEATLRLARAQEATLVPAYLMNVPNMLPIDSALPKQSQVALPIMEAIEQQATGYGVAVDTRVQRGRSTQHAVRKLIEEEQFTQVVVAARSATGSDGFGPDEVAWLLKNVPGEIIVIRADG